MGSRQFLFPGQPGIYEQGYQSPLNKNPCSPILGSRVFEGLNSPRLNGKRQTEPRLKIAS